MTHKVRPASESHSVGRSLAVMARTLRGRGLLPIGAKSALALAIVLTSLKIAPGLPGIMGAALGLLMRAIAITDMYEFIIPDALTAAGLGLALANAGIHNWGASMEGV